LDALADELALHDEFVLMDEVGYGGARKKPEEEKGGITDFDDGSELDLEDVKVEISQDDRDRAEKLRERQAIDTLSSTVEDIVSSVMEEILEVVLHQIEVSDMN